MPSTWRIDQLTSSDELDDVLAIEHASFTNPWTREMYLAELQNRDVSSCYVARTPEGRAAAFCSFWLVLDELHINNLAVAPDQRRRGAATALLQRVFADATIRGARRATLEVRRSNVEAQQLYERFGFVVSGVRLRYYSQPVEDALVLAKEPLAGP